MKQEEDGAEEHCKRRDVLAEGERYVHHGKRSKEVDCHYCGGPPRQRAEQEEDSTNELAVRRNIGRHERSRKTIRLEKLAEFIHPLGHEDIVRSAVDQRESEEEAEKKGTDVAVSVEHRQEEHSVFRSLELRARHTIHSGTGDSVMFCATTVGNPRFENSSFGIQKNS